MKRLILPILFMLFMSIPTYATNVIMNGQYVIIDDEILEQEAPPIEDISDALEEIDANLRPLEYLGEYTITYYCPCGKCNGYDKYGNPRSYDRYGNSLIWGTVAVDPKVLPLQTHLIIDGYDMEFVARDTGSGVNGKHIDMYVPVSHSEALRMAQGEKLKVWKVI